MAEAKGMAGRQACNKGEVLKLRPRRFPAQPKTEISAGIQASLERLWRLEDIMREMLSHDLPPAPGGQATTPADGPAEHDAVPHAPCHLSRRMLDELARAQGETPWHARPRRERGLMLVGSKRNGGNPSLYLRIDWHLRLRLNGESRRVRIDRLQGARWRSTGLYAAKDGSGGIEIDLVELERRTGPFSTELHRALARHRKAVSPRCP